MNPLPVPSPAAPSYAETLRESPWLTTLDRAFRVKSAEVERLEAEIVRLRVTNETLKRRLREAARRQLLWEDRRQAWRERERELEAQHG
jgi:hypothetical protein